MHFLYGKMFFPFRFHGLTFFYTKTKSVHLHKNLRSSYNNNQAPIQNGSYDTYTFVNNIIRATKFNVNGLNVYL